MLDPALHHLLHDGAVIPAHPLALTAERRFDERHQRALTRYYAASGAGGVAVGVHTTQFEIREPGIDLYEPVLALAADVLDREVDRPFLRVAGVAGPTAQAVAEAEIAAGLGYHAVLLSPPRPAIGAPEPTEDAMIERAAAVGEVLPVIGFYLQAAIRGPRLGLSFWRRFAELESVVAVKAAPFDRYRTLDVARAVAGSSRGADIALYTGNDDAIVADLLSDLTFDGPDGSPVTRRVSGGLLGHWSVWTRRAVELLDLVRDARAGDGAAVVELMSRAAAITDANAALFDPSHDFAGCIAGVHEVLRRQGLLAGTWCLDPAEGLSPGQSAEIDRVLRLHPWLSDDEFVAEHLDGWLR
ncbi:dihydrodipicolinate synthase family protein [Cellulomonas taurus]|uniref:dihydrodipicolinate synthase family protein n=1 Tax=Cellulomonas taurus TaxID=2729175 RepID=UPI00145D1003|nr:dihydrodipicolinate synthase family protein [Cellulomonas taurus]